ncbi:MAG: hypothetical protein H7281_11800 [Bacteriovorax sp.]|nr:hypothetical protein [Bacteriovorax sp.]
MKKSILLSIILISFTFEALAMGSKRPSTGTGGNTTPAPTPSPIHSPAPIPTAKPKIDLGPDLDPTEYLNTSAIVGPSVDQYQKQSALSDVRNIVNVDNVDKCFSDDKSHDLFSDQISYYAAMMFKDTPAMVGVIGSYYGTSDNDNNYYQTSLIRHPLCAVTAATLGKTLKNVPSQTTIDKLNRYAGKVNSLRNQVIAGDMKAKAELLNTWSRFFSCLGYTESLSSADSATSVRVAQKYAPTGYRKPASVEFYEDPSQPAESKLNIGMYQFTPTSSGNIQPCLRAWNEIHKNENASCLVNTKGTQAEMIKITGSSLQSFNAFCGIHKLIQTFSIQVNTTTASATHPNNLVIGKLLPADQRCVSPHFLAGKAYNHFGPFQNSTGTNMDKLFSCIERSQN